MDKTIFIRKPKKKVKDLSDKRKPNNSATYFMDIEMAHKYGKIRHE